MVRRLLLSVVVAVSTIAAIAQTVPEVYGTMRNSDSWGQQGSYYNPQHGFYKITTEDGTAHFARLTNESAQQVTDGALYANNRVYGVWTEVIKAFLGTYRSSLGTYDGESLVQLGATNSENANLYATSLTYDYIGGTAYMSAPKGYGSDGNPMIDYELKSLDLATGTVTTIGTMGYRVKGIAADPNGQLWGVGSGSAAGSTYLYKVDKATGKATIECQVSNLNLYDGVDKTSLLCDMRNGKLYLVAETYTENSDRERTFLYGIYEINKTTGRATCVTAFPSGELFVGCYLKQSHPKAPAAAVLSADAATVTLPTTAYDGTPLSSTLSIELTVGDNTTTLSGEAGASISTDLSLANGNNTVCTVVSNAYGPSIPTVVDVYVGNDTPAAVSDIRVEESNNGATAHVTWTAPTVGANGGQIDAARLSYRITRKPENKVIANGLTICEYTDNIDRVMGVTQYQVEAVIDGTASAPAYSAICTLGQPHPIPYLQVFGTQSDWMSYTVVDANGDANNETGGTWYFDSDYQAAMYFTNQRSADDYLFTPTLQLDATKVYRLQFQAWGYHDNNSVNHLQVKLATSASVEGITSTIMDEHLTNKSQAFAYGLFTPSMGDCRLAFHNVTNVGSDGWDHLFIDNILLQEYGTTRIADAPTDMRAVRLSSNRLKVTVKAPTTALDGTALTAIQSLDIYPAGNANQTLATIANAMPGQEYEFTIAPPYTGQVTLASSAVTTDGRGMEAYAITDTRNDVPAAVTDIRVTGRNAYTVAEVTWTQSVVGVNGVYIDPIDISYNIARIIGSRRTLIAEGVSGTTYTDRTLTEALGERQQDYITYEITPVTDGGQGATRVSATTLLGKSYDLPYAESFSNQQPQTYMWTAMNIVGGGSWTLSSTGYDPRTDAEDGDYGLLSFMTNRGAASGQTDYISPRIDASYYDTPTVTFYMYRATAYSGTTASLQAGIYTPETGVVMLTDEMSAYAQTDGWQKVTMTIPSPYATSDHLQLAFRAKTNSYTASIHIDNICMTGGRAAYEVKAERIDGAKQCVAGQENTYNVYVRNVGSNDVDEVLVTLMAGEQSVGEQRLKTLRTGDMQPVEFTFTPSLGATLGTLTLTANITCAQDGNQANNTVNTTVDVVAPMLPVVGDLEAVRTAEGVQLTWSDNLVYPRQEYVTEDCETITPFAIDNMNGWTTIDMDQAKTIQTSLDGQTVLQWDNSGEPQAWIAFNTARSGMEGITNAHSGRQMFVSFESTAAGGNDDWLVSPQLSGEEQVLTLYASCFYPYALDEKFELWVSRSVADDVERFEKISGNNATTVSSYNQWTQYKFTLPEGSRYFAIRCVSKGQYGLMIDDITYSPAHQPLEFWGYNVYRNGELVTAEPLAEPSFVDSEAPTHATYNVTAVYDLGESIYSNAVTVNTDGVTSLSRGNGATVKFMLDGQLYIRTSNGRAKRIDGI